MNNQRKPRIRSDTIRLAVADAPCMFAISGVCQNNGSVLCHIRLMTGAGIKPDDFHAAAGCTACHNRFDRREGHMSNEDRYYYGLRAQQRFIRWLYDAGLMMIDEESV